MVTRLPSYPVARHRETGRPGDWATAHRAGRLQAATLVRKSILLITLAIALNVRAGEWGSRGVPRRFAVNGDRLYAADGRGVAVYDIANARLIDVERSDDETRDLAVMGGSVVVATARSIDRFTIAGDGTLARADSSRDVRGATRIAASGDGQYIAAAAGTEVHILDPSFTRVDLLRFENNVTAVTFVGNTLYVGVAETAIYVVDPSTGAELTLLPTDALDFARSGATLWAASTTQGLVALDVSEPAQPQIISRTSSGVLKLTAIAASGSRVYGVEPPNVLRVFDASNPAEVRMTSTVTDWVHTIAAKDTRLFLNGTQIDGEGKTYETGVPVRIYDASNLASLRVAKDITDLAGAVSGAWTDGSVACIVDPPFLRVLDVSRTEDPREIASLHIEGMGDRIRVRDGKAILYGRRKVDFIDVSDPYKPKYLGRWDDQGHPPSAAAFLRDTIVEANEHSGLHIVDYSDPANARQIAGRIWHYHDVVAGDDVVYAMQLTTFLTLDVTNRNKVVDVSTQSAVGGAAQMDTVPPNSGSPQYLVWRGSDAIVLLSLEDRFAPREVARVPIPLSDLIGTSATSVFVARDGAISRIDVADPSQVAETGFRVNSPLQMSAAGEKLVIADRYSVRVYGPDTAPPPPPPPPPPTKRRATKH